jgi:hypothetical protein
MFAELLEWEKDYTIPENLNNSLVLQKTKQP